MNLYDIRRQSAELKEYFSEQIKRYMNYYENNVDGNVEFYFKQTINKLDQLESQIIGRISNAPQINLDAIIKVKTEFDENFSKFEQKVESLKVTNTVNNITGQIFEIEAKLSQGIISEKTAYNLAKNVYFGVADFENQIKDPVGKDRIKIARQLGNAWLKSINKENDAVGSSKENDVKNYIDEDGKNISQQAEQELERLTKLKVDYDSLFYKLFPEVEEEIQSLIENIFRALYQIKESSDINVKEAAQILQQQMYKIEEVAEIIQNQNVTVTINLEEVNELTQNLNNFNNSANEFQNIITLRETLSTFSAMESYLPLYNNFSEKTSEEFISKCLEMNGYNINLAGKNYQSVANLLEEQLKVSMDNRGQKIIAMLTNIEEGKIIESALTQKED